MYAMKSIDDLWEHIAYVLAYAPDDFPHEDFLPADQQMNLEKAFEQLRKGVCIAYPEPTFSDKRTDLYLLLDKTLVAYAQGNVDQACDLLNEFQGKIFEE